VQPWNRGRDVDVHGGLSLASATSSRGITSVFGVAWPRDGSLTRSSDSVKRHRRREDDADQEQQRPSDRRAPQDAGEGDAAARPGGRRSASDDAGRRLRRLRFSRCLYTKIGIHTYTTVAWRNYVLQSIPAQLHASHNHVAIAIGAVRHTHVIATAIEQFHTNVDQCWVMGPDLIEQLWF